MAGVDFLTEKLGITVVVRGVMLVTYIAFLGLPLFFPQAFFSSWNSLHYSI